MHLDDDGTHFNAAKVLPNTAVKYFWNTFLRCWFIVYIGIPNRILVDQGTEFEDMFVHLAD